MAKTSVKITDVDHGYKEMLKRLRQARTNLTVGLHEAEGAEEKRERTHEHEAAAGKGKGPAKEEHLTLVEVASFHEFGLGVPRRSFIADWYEENKANHEKQLRQMAKAIVTGEVASLEEGLNRLGALYVGEVQKRISDGIEPGLKEATVKAKGSSVPLIDTGQLRTSIRFHVKPGGGGGGEGGGGESSEGGGEE